MVVFFCLLFSISKETDQPGEILLMDFGLGAGEKSTTLLNGLDDEDSPIEKDITVFSSIHTPNERNEMLEVDIDGERLLGKSKRVSKLDQQQQHESNLKLNRKKRQADLSSHTQDGVPIFDRGYGATPNRTEGLRIYQSLLANNGRNEPQPSPNANLQTDTTVVQPHHRQNNFWRNRKEKPRHRHQKATTRSPLTDDIELSSVAEFDAANGQDLRSSDTTSPPAKSSVAPNVEFRHSRVKTSSETRENGPLSVDQKIWSTSRNNGIFSIGAGPYAGASQEDRISAATAPAILTKTVTASVGSSSQVRHQQQQPNIYKVNQPAVNSRSSSSQGNSENEDLISRDSPPSSPSSSSGKKRINKKQLRDLSHTATAVHLVADTRNSTSTSFENQGNHQN